MYKVLFADDEPIALEGIALLTDWEKLGFEICGLCSNGEEALAAAGSSQPDLIITDIRMPGLDGLQLISRIKQELDPAYDPMFVIMSGYGDFEYARSALRYGVNHYLLKPVLDTDWEPVMEEIQERLQSKWKKRECRLWMQSRVLETALTRTIRGDAAELDEEVAGRLERLDQESEGWRYIHIERGMSEVAEAVKRMKLPYPRVMVLDWAPGHTGLVAEISLDVMGIARSLYQELAEPEASVTVGPPVRSLRELSVSYSGAVEAAIHHFFHAGHGPVEYGSGVTTGLSYDLKAMKTVEQLLSAAEKLEEEETGALIGRLIRLFREENTAPEVIQTLGVHMVLSTIETLRELGAESELWTKYRDLLRTVPKSISELEQSLRSYMAEYMNRLRRHKESACGQPLQAVERYIRDNYRKPMTIKEIGARFFLNPVYLGSAFSNKYGIGIIEYIHDLRIQEAKRLLRETDQTVSSIAEAVGYVQYNHFLMEFGKRVAEKPSAYRKKTREQA
ncbi:response regulator [Gorillibacterium sp. sgz5001074]|uniref:response regulator n=1 Tax=Gorillibacterium sp. sgz5001074 TaxID=3446695 RepID=UPI003F66327D